MGLEPTVAPERLPASAARVPIEAALEAFREVTEAVSGDAELAAVLDVVAAGVCRLLSADRCAVYLLDEESSLYRGHLLRTRGRTDDRIKRLTCGVEADRFTREILSTRAPVVIADARSDPRPVRSAMLKLDVRSVIGLPMVLSGTVVGILYVDVEGTRRAFGPEDVHVAGAFANLAGIVVDNARSTARLRTTLDTIGRQNASLRRAAIAENRLAELVLDGADLDEVAANVAQLTSKACAIYGEDGRRIGGGTPPGESREPALLELERCARPEIAEALAGLRPGTTSVIGPFRDSGVPHRLLISPVAVGGEEWGRIVLVERGSRLTGLDAQVARRAAMIIALEISARRRASELTAQSAEMLVRDLVLGTGDADQLRSRARFQRLRIDAPQLVCLLSDGHGGAWTGPEPDAIVAALGPCVRAVATCTADGIALVLDADAAADAPVQAGVTVIEELLAGLPAAPAAIGAVSGVFSGVAGYKRAYQEARQVVRCMQRFGDGSSRRVLAGEELGAGCVFLASTTREDADAFLHQTLGPLLDGDDQAMRDLLNTLAVFFAASRSVRRTADLIGMHENTIRYRLARISELTGLDVATNADHQLAGQLATLTLRLEGRLSLHEVAA